jgi:hypothetical protein
MWCPGVNEKATHQQPGCRTYNANKLMTGSQQTTRCITGTQWMHSKHATSATQDTLDALMIKYPPCPLTITSTEVTTDPQHHTATASPPLHLQQPAAKPSIFPSDSDSQHSFTYLWKPSGSSTLISLISVVKSEFSRDFTYPNTRNAAQTSTTPRPTPQSFCERVPSSCGPSQRWKQPFLRWKRWKS